MKMVNHHPTDELLTAYSAGSLQLSHALCVSAHVDHCQQCQVNMKRLNALGGRLLDQLEPQSANTDGLKDSVMALLDQQAPAEEEPVVQANNTHIPACLKQFIPGDYSELSWQSKSPSIQTVPLCTDENGAQVALLKIKPGGKVGHHSHMGDEVTMILEGSFSDEFGIYRKGDFMLHGSDHKHKPIATKDAECICLIVQDAPIQFTGFFSRLLNPFLRNSHYAQ
jgi:putative transcriptional regulator